MIKSKTFFSKKETIYAWAEPVKYVLQGNYVKLKFG